MDIAKLSPGSYHLLNDSSVPFLSRLKLCRVLWVSDDCNLPRRCQLLLNWICGQLPSQQRATEFKLCFETVVEFLKSKELSAEISTLESTHVCLKLSLVQALSAYLQGQTGKEVTDNIIVFGETIFAKSWIACPVKTQFDAFAPFVSQWMKFVIEQIKSGFCLEALTDACKHVVFLLEKTKQFLKGFTARKKALQTFCKHLLSPLLEFQYRCWRAPEFNKGIEDDVRSVGENVIASILFSRENLHLFEDFSASHTNTDSDAGNVNRRHKKIQKLKRLNLIMGVLQEISSTASLDPHLAAYSIEVFFHLFLTHAKCDGGMKVDVLLDLAKLACLCDKKCDDGILTCKSLNIMMIHGLLKTAVKHRLYQPAVNQDVGEKLLQWLQSLLQNLLDGYNVSSEWLSCMICLAKVDKSIAEPWMKSILTKSVGGVSKGSVYPDKVVELIHSLVDTYVKIRQSVRLVNIVLIVVENASDNENRTFDWDHFSEAIEEFGQCLGSMFTSTLSPSLIMEIWAAILQNIEQKIVLLMDQGQTRLSSVTITLQLLVKFFAIICGQSPIFALWDHLTVRKELDTCFATLERSVKLLRSVMDIEGWEKGLRNRVTETYLNITLVKTKLETNLKRYAVVGSEIVKPGYQILIFQKGTEVPAPPTEAFNEIQMETLNNDSKLAFLHLVLLRLKSVTEDVEIFHLLTNKCQVASDGAIDLSRDTEQDLVDIKQQLENVLSFMKMYVEKYVMGHPDSFLVNALMLVAKFVPVLLFHNMRKLYDWMNNTVLLMVFCEDIPSLDGLEEALNAFFRFLSCAQNGHLVLFELLEKASIKLSGIMPKKFSLGAIGSEVVEMTDVPMPSVDDADVISSGIQKYLRITDSVSLGILLEKRALPVFVHALNTTKLACLIVEKLGVKEKFQGLVDRLVKTMLRLTDGRRMQLLQKCQPDHLLPFVARLHSFVSSQNQRLVAALQHELILICYRDSLTFDCIVKEPKLLLSESGNVKSTEVQTMSMISQHASVLINLVSFGDRKDDMALHRESRKRKLRSDEQISKKLKLDEQAETPQLKQKIFLNLQKLYSDSCKVMKAVGKVGKNYYEMLATSVQVLSVLNSDENYDLKVDRKIRKAFGNALETITAKEDVSITISKLAFIKRCLQCPALQYDYECRHLQKLILLFNGLALDEDSLTELSGCLICLVRRIPAEHYQKDLFNEVIRHIRTVSDSQKAKCYTKFAAILIRSDILESHFQNEDVELQKLLKRQCSRFLKCLLEELQTLISKHLKTTTTFDVSFLTSTNECICEVLKTNWVKFQTTEICNTFVSLHEIHLEGIRERNGPDAFFALFKSYNEVVHSILVTFREVGQMAAICISAFRHLLKAAIHLGKQRDQPDLTNGDQDYRVSIQCCGVLEKLFQLVADKHKKDFSKCMSYVVADYVCIISSTTIVPSVKKPFTNAVYHLMGMMDEYDTAMVRRSLPLVVRDTFQALILDYAKNFKYKGFV